MLQDLFLVISSVLYPFVRHQSSLQLLFFGKKSLATYLVLALLYLVWCKVVTNYCNLSFVEYFIYSNLLNSVIATGVVISFPNTKSRLLLLIVLFFTSSIPACFAKIFVSLSSPLAYPLISSIYYLFTCIFSIITFSRLCIS